MFITRYEFVLRTENALIRLHFIIDILKKIDPLFI